LQMVGGEAVFTKGISDYTRTYGEPHTPASCPPIGSVIRVLIEHNWQSCVVQNFHPPEAPNGHFKFVVKYDDGMLIEDRLSLPWHYVLAPSSRPPQVEAGCSSDPINGNGFEAIVQAAAQMEADHDAKESDESAGTPSPHSSHSGFSTATAFLGNPSLVDAQSHLELDAFEEVPAEDGDDSF
jgi:hypothetical protein